MNKTDDQIIHEAMGKCWHDFSLTKSFNGFPETFCAKCGQDYKDQWGGDLKSYTSNWADYGPMLEWAQKQEWWPAFKRWCFVKLGIRVDFIPDCLAILLSPSTGAPALAEFWKGKESRG